jgi:hypothetical protein
MNENPAEKEEDQKSRPPGACQETEEEAIPIASCAVFSWCQGEVCAPL